MSRGGSGCIIKSDSRCLAEYTLNVSGSEALLDYGGRFEKINSSPERDFCIGQTKITFLDPTRSAVVDVRWRDKGSKHFLDYDIKASWAQVRDVQRTKARDPFAPGSGDRRLRGALEAVLRPGQLRFRIALLGVYGSRCCITGSELVETLEAAHIMPYRGASYDHVQNGLLLRADLHRLYDRLLISIPSSRRALRCT